MDWTRTRRQLMAGAARTGLAALVAAGLVHGAAAQDEKLAPLADGFPNKPIVLLVIDEPGSTDSVYANQIAEQASRISPQRIVVEHRVDFTNFGTWEGIAWLKDQGALASDGYIAYVLTQPDAMIDMVAIDIEDMTGVTFEDFNPIIATEQVPFMLIQRADAPWGDTLDDFVKYAKENPGTVRHITGGPGGGQDAAMRVWLRHLGVTVNDIIGGNPTERALAVASGEGDITVSPVDVLTPHHDAGRIEVLMGSGSDAFPAPWDNVPSAGSLGMEDDPFDQTRTIAVSPDVSAEHAAWLFELFSKAAADPGYRERRQQISGLTPIEFDREQSRAHAQTGYDKVLPIFKDLGIYWGDQQQ